MLGNVEDEPGRLFRIETKALVLRPFELGDTAAVYTLSNEPSFRQWLPSQVYADEGVARGVLEFLIDQYAAPADPRRGPYVLAVDHRDDGTLIGHVGLSPFEGDVEIGFAIAEAYRRRGLAVEAVIATCRWAFGKFGLPRILGIAAQSNRGSTKVLARAGFEHQVDHVMKFQGSEQAVSVYNLSGERKERQVLMRSKTTILLMVLLVLVVSNSAYGQTDLDTYIAERRAAGMTEWAEVSLKTVANLLSGASIFSVQKLEDGGYGRSYMSAHCFNPDDDSAESKLLRAEITEKSDKELYRLRALADLDGSGFVSTEEGTRVRELVEFGLQFEQMDAPDKENVEKVAVAYGKNVEWVRTAVDDYRRLASAFNAGEGTKLPEVALAKEE